MTTDRELLELAAKAAGIKFHAYVENEFFGNGINTGALDRPLWNPLTDDGDALRLAVDLELDIFFNDGDTDVLNVSEGGGDPYARTRRAIVRAAAEIGRSLP